MKCRTECLPAVSQYTFENEKRHRMRHESYEEMDQEASDSAIMIIMMPAQRTQRSS